MLIPAGVELPSVSPDDLRIGNYISKPNEAPRVVLIGFPSDEGVRRNGGRAGAAGAPASIRAALYKLTPDPTCYDPFVELLTATRDLGDVEVTGDVEADQIVLAEVVAEWTGKGAIPIIIGGGHETAYGHFLSYVKNESPVHIVNIDAHADVRPLKLGKAHSGSPFYQSLEHPDGICQSYTVLGLASWSVSRAHVDYLDRHDCTYTWVHEMTAGRIEQHFSNLDAPTMVTFDMDVVDSCAAPGVSAPAAGGIPLSLFLASAYCAGKSRHVTSFDLVEVNPKFDADHRTAKAAAVTVWHFLKGLIDRDR